EDAARARPQVPRPRQLHYDSLGAPRRAATGRTAGGTAATDAARKSRQEESSGAQGRGQDRAMSETFGSYTLLEQIGVGGMAEVFLARHAGVEGFEKEVVIKRIRPHLSATDAFVTMFLGEAKLAAQLAHPNIVQIHDLGLI